MRAAYHRVRMLSRWDDHCNQQLKGLLVKQATSTTIDAGITTAHAPAKAPGKVTRSSAIQLKAAAGATVQARGADRSAGGDVHSRAAAGVSGASGTLPHGTAIQKSFGHHDVSGIESHQGGAASSACDSMGAMAYATGTHVAFKQSPDLHTAAHEAAHVVQQKGGVQLAGGVGQSGDRYEQHADAVADAVVAGGSAEGLLDDMAPAGGTASGTAVQHLREDENAPDPGGQCRELTQSEIITLLAKVSLRQPITPSEQLNLRTALEAMDNSTFATYLRVLDTMGILQTVLQQLYGHAGTTGGGTAQREFPVVCYRFWNAADQIDADVATANTIYGHHGIMITAVSKREISKADTERVVGSTVDDNFKLDRTYAGASGAKRYTHADMVAVLREFVPTTVVGGLWAKRVLNQSGVDLSGTSAPVQSMGAGYHKLAAVATDYSGADTFAHELGHILAEEGHTGSGLMETGSSRDKTQTGAD